MERRISSQEDVLRRWPRLTAHLIAESLGYFTPKDAASAVFAYKNRRAYHCEWYLHLQRFSPGATLEDVGEIVIENAIKRRHCHNGFMSNYLLAKEIVAESIKGHDPILASWF
jgi:hypothetical protein